MKEAMPESLGKYNGFDLYRDTRHGVRLPFYAGDSRGRIVESAESLEALKAKLDKIREEK
jgi:hypothetical protein